ncbi:hypothetical protein GAYE_SCF20G4079 [Galdieria yellowstonensis]|uniref:Nucleoporin p58/p45 n=1 Tax=Galdieria yellowstonensis TaxID=3028027 RepID=A0AAV9IFD6_9RHOD|nr:hypothetical protein GAYE_SCF20G4079 [Galdieria yellowstonensis]
MSFSWNTSNPASSPTISFGVPQNFASPATQSAPFSQPMSTANQATGWFSPSNQSPWAGYQSQPSLQGNLFSSKPPTFGSPPVTTSQPSIFTTQPSGMVSSTMNAFMSSPSATNMTQTSPQQEIKAMKFSNLPDTMKNEILEIEKSIRSERQKSLKLETQNNLQQLEETQARIDKTFQHLQIAQNTWDSLVVKVQACKNVIKNEMSSVETVYAILESTTRDDVTSFPRKSEEAVKRVFDIFFSYLKEMEETVEEYEKQTQTAVAVLQNVSRSIGWKGQAIEDVLKQEYEYFIFVGSRIANLRDKFRQLKEKFSKLLQYRNPDAVNPFQVNNISKPSYWNERYDTPLNNTSVSSLQQPSNSNVFRTPMTRWKSPLMTKGLQQSLGRIDERNISTPLTDYSRRRDFDYSSFKTPLPQVTRSSVSSFLP